LTSALADAGVQEIKSESAGDPPPSFILLSRGSNRKEILFKEAAARKGRTSAFSTKHSKVNAVAQDPLIKEIPKADYKSQGNSR